jgi:hypothetical protein
VDIGGKTKVHKSGDEWVRFVFLHVRHGKLYFWIEEYVQFPQTCVEKRKSVRTRCTCTSLVWLSENPTRTYCDEWMEEEDQTCRSLLLKPIQLEKETSL